MEQEKSDKQHKSSFDWLKEYQWQKGQSGNPAGRPKTRTLKEFAREYLSNMSEEGRIAYFQKLDEEVVWKMAEGNPKNDVDLNAKITIADVLKDIENETAIGQTVEAETFIQDSGQEEEPDKVQPQQSTGTLQPEQVVEKYNT